ncbi:uncharacterized protein M421DRAFT_383532 [Didymella exigua CBS 183.55]|uniref:Uncharacterized protein n=1 Tax=Didymella exigua CBS 183.55 TaxID=1150837 RepID=A0A6A5RSH1_9PLEO|nr:uncharacterized protein M421DRAFT_383532 [Didymella exigua CBS 183.55]KAF1930044.1 hypothetical protein M421DRAFT_383532 [Didymella exigua CBS 183.55]
MPCHINYLRCDTAARLRLQAACQKGTLCIVTQQHSRAWMLGRLRSLWHLELSTHAEDQSCRARVANDLHRPLDLELHCNLYVHCTDSAQPHAEQISNFRQRKTPHEVRDTVLTNSVLSFLSSLRIQNVNLNDSRLAPLGPKSTTGPPTSSFAGPLVLSSPAWSLLRSFSSSTSMIAAARSPSSSSSVVVPGVFGPFVNFKSPAPFVNRGY